MIFPVIPSIQAELATAQPGSAYSKVFSRFESAFIARGLDSLSNPDGANIHVIVNHSLREGERGQQSFTFKSFDEFESWLRSNEHGGKEPGEDLLPTRAVSAIRRYSHESLHYENQGISHNTIYLSKVRLSRGPKGISVVEVVLYDGD